MPMWLFSQDCPSLLYRFGKRKPPAKLAGTSSIRRQHCSIFGFGVFLATEMVVNGKPPGGAIPLFLIPGVLFLISFGLRKALRIPGRARPE